MIKRIAQIVSWSSLVVLIVPPVLFLVGKMTDLDRLKLWMLGATIVWFVASPLWMWERE